MAAAKRKATGTRRKASSRVKRRSAKAIPRRMSRGSGGLSGEGGRGAPPRAGGGGGHPVARGQERQHAEEDDAGELGEKGGPQGEPDQTQPPGARRGEVAPVGVDEGGGGGGEAEVV